MDRLTIPNGGMELHGDDFNWLQNGVKDAFKGVLHYFAQAHNGNIILSGLADTYPGSGMVLSEGYVLLDYEVCYFPGATFGSLPGIGQAVRLSLDVTYDPTGLEVFADSVSKNTYERRRAKAQIVIDTGGLFTIGSPRLQDIIIDIAGTAATTTTLSINQNGWSIGSEICRARKQFNRIYLKGKIDGGTTNNVAFILPVGYRPLQLVLVPVAISEAPYNGYLKIESNGNCTVVTDGNFLIDGTNFVSLYGVDFPID